MPAATPREIVRSADKAWGEKQQWEALLRACYTHGLPQRNPYWNGTGRNVSKANRMGQGQKKHSAEVFDSTLLFDVIKLANRIQSELIPDGQEWAEFEPGPFVSQDNIERAKRDLYALQKMIFAFINMSNFSSAMGEWLLELVTAGTALMMILEGDPDGGVPIEYACIPQAQVALRCGANGKFNGYFREHTETARAIEEMWPDVSFDDRTQQQITDDPDMELDLCEATYWDAKSRRWYFDVILRDKTEEKNDSKIVSRTYRMSRIVAGRWLRSAGETQGRSPVMTALPDVQTLNAVKELLLRNAALSVSGVWLARADGTVNPNNIKIRPGAIIGVKSTGGPNGASLSRLEVGGDLQLAQILIEDLVRSIHRVMHNTGLPDDVGQPRTATEWMVRLRELQQDLGSPISRVINEGIVPILETTLYMLAEQGVAGGALEGFRNGVVKLNSGDIKLRFTSPLTEAQNMRDVERLTNASAVSKQVVGPQADMLNLKVEDAGAWIYGKFGVDPVLIRNEKERSDFQGVAGQLIAAQGMQVPNVQGGVAPGAAANQNAPQQALAA